MATCPLFDAYTVLASAAYTNAIRSNDVVIPVYAQDGTTVIGEFVVGFGC